MKKRHKLLNAVIIIIGIMLSACTPRLSIKELEGDLVFVSDLNKYNFQLNTYHLADDEVESVNIPNDLLFPTVDLKNNRFVCLTSSKSTMSSGYLTKANLKTGKLERCRGPVSSSVQLDPRQNNENYVILGSSLDVKIVDIATCETVETLYDVKKDRDPEEIFHFIERVSMSRDGKYLYMATEENTSRAQISIFQLNLTTREKVFLVNGNSPSIAPDGNRLAFIDDDKIKNLDIDTRAVIDFDRNKFPENYHFFTLVWDESGSKLLIEMFYDNEYDRDKKIFILDVYSGNVTEISTPGMQPSWIRK